MIVRAAGDDAETAFRPTPPRPSLGVGYILVSDSLDEGSIASFRQTALAAMVLTSGPPCVPGR